MENNRKYDKSVLEQLINADKISYEEIGRKYGVTGAYIKKIAKLLKNVELTATELLGFDLSMITSGGVSLREINDKTMKSKIIENLFFAGEMIDIDGKTGGFNLQECWSTGYLAGKSAAGL